MTDIVDIKNLHVRFEDGGETVDALRGIDLSIGSGERVAVIGRSGSGKSSLMRVLSGLISPDQGRVRIDDQVLGPDDDPDRSLYRGVGLVFQDYGLVPQLTAEQNVMCGGLHDRPAFRGWSRFGAAERRRARGLLGELGLEDRFKTRASRLSGGEQQRVAIARLLFQEPDLMLLDEPVASLDVHWADHVVDLLSNSNDGDSTLVMVLHDLSMARQFADRVVYLRDGRVVFDGDPEEACRQLEDQVPNPELASTDGSVREAPASPPSPPSGAPASTGSDRQPAGDLTSPAIAGIDLLDGLWRTFFYAGVTALAVALYIWAALGVEFSFARIFDNLDGAVDFGSRMLPPDLTVTATVAESLVETIQMALIGTTLAAVVSLPLAVMAARNVSPFPVQAVSRLLLNGLRTIPSIIWGLFFVAIVGLGPFPGILALTFYAAGYLGKFYYEGIESIDTAPLRSLQTVGASPLHQVRWGVLPQVFPLLLGYTLYMFEYNVRAASILGIVGAGGIGFYLYTYINNFKYDQAATALLLLLVVVTLIDVASSRLRARLMD